VGEGKSTASIEAFAGFVETQKRGSFEHAAIVEAHCVEESRHVV
jgi:hypothetical protein